MVQYRSRIAGCHYKYSLNDRPPSSMLKSSEKPKDRYEYSEVSNMAAKVAGTGKKNIYAALEHCKRQL